MSKSRETWTENKDTGKWTKTTSTKNSDGSRTVTSQQQNFSMLFGWEGRGPKKTKITRDR